MNCRARIASLLIFFLLSAAVTPAAEQWRGGLRIQPKSDLLQSGGSVSVTLTSMTRKNKDGSEEFNPKYTAGRKAEFYLLPYRFNLFRMDLPQKLSATGTGTITVKLPKVRPGWYVLYAVIENDKQELLPIQNAVNNPDYRGMVGETVIAITDADVKQNLRVHTERSRCVFSPGEMIRLFVSVRGAEPISGTATVKLLPRGWEAEPMTVATGPVNAAEGKSASVVFDLDPKLTRAIAPGQYDLVLEFDGAEMDRYPVQFVSAERPNPMYRMWHGYLYPMPGAPRNEATPWNSKRESGWIHEKMRLFNAFMNMGATGVPIIGPKRELPHADNPALPPLTSTFRPAQFHVRAEMLMSQGARLDVHNGWAEAGSENYMPLPTAWGERMDRTGRKYLQAALGMASHPNFTGFYTDIYSKPDWHGGAELERDELQTAREKLYEAACKASGLDSVPPAPYSYNFEKIPRRITDAVGKDKQKAFGKARDTYAKTLNKNVKRGRKEMRKLARAEKAKLWQQFWTAAGVTPAPEPNRNYPFVMPDDVPGMTPDQEYKYALYVHGGVPRTYKRITEIVNEEMPSVWTLHNRRRQNHRNDGYGFTDNQWSRGPALPPEACRGATVVFSSEWNLDAEPQPYNGPAHYLQPLVDDGRPAWATAVHARNGSQQRYLRDGVFLWGRGMTPVYENPGNCSWSFKGADQSAYGGYDRLYAVQEFLNQYESLFGELEAVREIGLYVGPYWSDAWSYLAIPTAFMTGHQVHVIPASELPAGKLGWYKAVFAPWIPRRVDEHRPFVMKAFEQYTKQGGKVVAAPCKSGYFGDIDYSKYGITRTKETVTDRKGRSKEVDVWNETMPQREAMCREEAWGYLKDGVSTVGYDFATRWGYEDENGEKQKFSKRHHWTGHPMAGNLVMPAIEAAPILKAALDKVNDPLVVKDKWEVFAHAMRPRDKDAQGTYLFVSNWTLPKHKSWTEYRVPFMFYTTFVEPVVATLKVKKDGIGAVYDLMKGEKIAHSVEGDRIVFKASLASVEGRVFALLPEPIASATLQAPETVAAGETLNARFTLMGQSGAPLPVLGSVAVKLTDAKNNILADLYRALPKDGTLPPLPIAQNVAGPLRLEVQDTISGQTSVAQITVSAPVQPAQPAAAITVYRGDKIHDWLQANKGGIRIVLDSGYTNWAWKDDPADVARIKTLQDEWTAKETKRKEEAKAKKKKFKKKKSPKWPKPKRIRVLEVKTPNPDLDRERSMATTLAKKLNAAGIKTTVVESKDAISGSLSGNPWNGGGRRNGHTVPRLRIDGPVILIGSARSNSLLGILDRAYLSAHSLLGANTAEDRGIIVWLPRLFNDTDATVAVVGDDTEGLDTAITKLVALASTQPGPDPYYQAREAVRMQWTPDDIVRWKASQQVLPAENSSASANLKSYPSKALPVPSAEELLGVHVYGLDASAGGVAVSTTSLAKPIILVKPDGSIAGSYGGGGRLWPRDIGISADGNTIFAGFALSGETVAYKADGAELFDTVSGFTYKAPLSGVSMYEQFKARFAWDTFKDSERYLATSPDKSIVVYSDNSNASARNTETGKVLWTIENDKPQYRRAVSFPQISISPDNTHTLVMRNHKTGEEPVLDKKGKPRTNPDGTPMIQKIYKEEFSLVELSSGKVIWSAPVDVSGWELYTAVGPKGEWSITSGRGSTFALRDEQGLTARVFKPEHLPKEMRKKRGPNGQIAPLYLTGLDPNHIVLTKPETKGLYYMKLTLGSAAAREKAQETQLANKDVARQLKKILSDRKKYRGWNKKKLEAIFAPFHLPQPAGQRLLDKAAKLPGEMRAGRKRDFRFVDREYDDVVKAMFARDSAIIEAAADLQLERAILLPAIICDVSVNPALTHAYVGLWDGTVRAYDLATGKEIWSAPVKGGCQIAITEVGGKTIVYAGGSRGDLYQFDGATGKENWRINITEPTTRIEQE